MKPRTVTVELTEQDINQLLRALDVAWRGASAMGENARNVVGAAEQTVTKIMRAGLEHTQAAKFADTIIEEVRS